MKGLSEFLKSTEAIRKRAQACLEAAVKSGALVIQNDAKVKAPYLTGNLRRSISAYIKEENPEEVLAIIGTNVEYAKFQEYGTSKMKAHPYLRPAFDENIEKAKKTMAAVFQKALFG